MTALDTQLIAAIGFLMTLIVGGTRYVYLQQAARLKACEDKLTTREAAEQAALDAFRVNQAEQAKLWLKAQELSDAAKGPG